MAQPESDNNEWRVVFALDCHGGMVISGVTKEEAIKIFKSMDAKDLFETTQVRGIRLIGIIPEERRRKCAR